MVIDLKSSMVSFIIKPINAEATFVQAQGCKDFLNTSKPCCVGIHRIALAEYSQMSIHIPGFQSFFKFLFCIILYWPHTQQQGLILLTCNNVLAKTNNILPCF